MWVLNLTLGQGAPPEVGKCRVKGWHMIGFYGCCLLTQITISEKCYIHLVPLQTWCSFFICQKFLCTRDLASDPSTRLFRRAIVIFDGQKNDHDGFVYRRAKWKLVKYSTYICTSFYKNGKYQPVSTLLYHLLNDNHTQNIIRRL